VEDIKKNILANLEYLPDKVNFKKETPQVVILNSHYFDNETNEDYSLSVECVVEMERKNDEIVIDGFYIEQQFVSKNNGSKAGFKFTKDELNDYIDF
jgi:hypothetical protein